MAPDDPPRAKNTKLSEKSTKLAALCQVLLVAQLETNSILWNFEAGSMQGLELIVTQLNDSYDACVWGKK